MVDTHGRALLREFLERNNLGQADCARGIVVSAPTVHDYLHGIKRPKDAQREAIEVWTNGFVPASSWRTAEEQAKATTIRGFDPNTTSS